MKNLELNRQKASSIATTLLSVLILSNAQLSTAGEADYPPQPNAGQATSTDQATEKENIVSRFFHGIGKALSNENDPNRRAKADAAAAGTAGVQTPTPVAITNRRIVPGLRKEDNCLVLDQGEDFYPLYTSPSESIQPKTYLDPRLQDISINLNGLAPSALKKSKGAGIEMSQWPIILHGPIRLCGSVDLQFQAISPDFIANRTDRLEIGPGLIVNGIRNVSIVSSQLMNLEITGACVGQNNFDYQTPCIRLTDDKRTSQNHRLFIKHDGPKICRIDGKIITDLELRTAGYTKSNPLPCNLVSENAPSLADIQVVDPVVQTVAQPVVAPPSVTLVTPVVRPAVTCDGPYIALIRPTEVSLDYGLRPVTIQPVRIAVQEPIVAVPPPVVEKLNPKTLKPNPKTLKAEPKPKDVDPKILKSAKAAKPAAKPNPAAQAGVYVY